MCKEDLGDIRGSHTLQLLEIMDEHLAFGIRLFVPFIKTKIVDNQFMNFEDFLNDIEIVVIMVALTHNKKICI